MSIAIVVLTHNRVHLLRQCVDNVLLRTSPRTSEIVIWNNASTDGTRSYLETLSDPRIRVVHHDRNIGHNAYAPAVALTSAAYMLELDDDIIDAPPNWDRTLLDAYVRLPDVGFLAANLVNNPNDVTSRIMYGPSAHLYRYEDVNGVRLKLGPTGGGCTITDRELYDRVGGFPQNKKSVFWQEDAVYIERIRKLGYRAAYLADLEVFHAGGPYYAEQSREKLAYWERHHRTARRKRAIKRALVRVPFVRRLNDRYRWFRVPPKQA